MPFLGRALYNLMRSNAEKGNLSEVKDWQIRNYRELSIDELIEGLNSLNVEIDIDTFELVAAQVDAPEEIAASIAPPGEPRDRVYLYIFELWRRLLDDRETISIFCDELDHVISLYDDDPASSDEMVYSMLKELVGILEQNVTLGQKPITLFSTVSDFLSCDLESFIYNYIQDLIEQDKLMVASEITSNFSPYVKQSLWFELLKLKLLSGVPSEDASAMMSRFIENLEEARDLDLYFELLHYINKTGHVELFSNVFRKAIDLIKTQEEYVEILDILFEFTQLNDRKREEKAVETILEKIRNSPRGGLVTKKEKKQLQELVQ